MKVSEAMTRDVKVCVPTQSLTSAAKIMWEEDCGCVPVLSDEGLPVGMVTDRDLCMSAYHEGGRLDQIPVGQAMSRHLVTCKESDDLKDCQAMMREHRVRRLPVIDGEGRLVGVLSLADMFRASKTMKPAATRTAVAKQLAETLCEVSDTHRPFLEDTDEEVGATAASKPAGKKVKAAKSVKSAKGTEAAKPAKVAKPAKGGGAKASGRKGASGPAEGGQSA